MITFRIIRAGVRAGRRYTVYRRRAFSFDVLGEVERLHAKECEVEEKIVSYEPARKVRPISRQSAEQRLTSPPRAGALIHAYSGRKCSRLDM